MKLADSSPLFSEVSTTAASVSCRTSGSCTPNYSVGHRTPISSRAKPFLPGLGRHPYSATPPQGVWDAGNESPVPKPPGVWHHPVVTAKNDEAVGTPTNVWLPVTLVQILPAWGSFSMGGCASRDKTMQEEPSEVYNEELQDDVYLQEGLRETATRLLAGNIDVAAAKSGRIASRTPSPPPRTNIHPDVHGLNRHVSMTDMSEWRQPKEQELLSDAEVDEEPIPVKHTFIHYGETLFEQRPRRLERSVSAPGHLMSGRFRLKVSPMTLAHLRNECKPCAYYINKEDGCRLGDECKFCHWCTGIDIKRRKKEKKRTLKQAYRKPGKALCTDD